MSSVPSDLHEEEGFVDYNPTERDIALINCDAMRKKINLFLATHEMTQTQFLNDAGICSSSLGRFMKLKGKDNGYQNSTFWQAQHFFQDRGDDLRGQSATGKRSAQEMQATSSAPVKSAFEMTAEDLIPPALFKSTVALVPRSFSRDEVNHATNTLVTFAQSAETSPEYKPEVFDDCDEIRRKIGVMTQSGVMNATGFAHTIGISTNAAVNKFLMKKGADQGAGSTVYPNAYRFFEKLRIAAGTKKSTKRLSAERSHLCGFPLENPRTKRWVFIGR